MVDFAISIVLVPTLLGWLKPETRAAAAGDVVRAADAGDRAALDDAGARLVMAVAVVARRSWRSPASRGCASTRITSTSSARPSARRSRRRSSTRSSSGIYTFQILLEGPPDSLRSPTRCGAWIGSRRELRKLPFVRKVTGLADYVKRVHRELGGPHGDDSGRSRRRSRRSCSCSRWRTRAASSSSASRRATSRRRRSPSSWRR